MRSTLFRAVALIGILLIGLLASGVSGYSVLALVPSQAYLRLSQGSLVRVGSYLDEVAIPSVILMREGIEMTFASPEGNVPPVDPRSNTTHYFPASGSVPYQEALNFWNSNPSFNNPIQLTDLVVEDPDAPVGGYSIVNETLLNSFDALFIPGGHAPMIDLWPSTAVARIILHFFDANKTIAAICHGPLVLASTTLLRQPFVFNGYNMTVFSEAEEKLVEKDVWNGVRLGYYPQNVLAGWGGVMLEAAPFKENVIVDGNLITGQNPYSAEKLGRTLRDTILMG
jgi:putative intracellular protease/amidase